MPRMNGSVFLSMIKRNKNLKNIPVVIYSSDIAIYQEKELINAGAQDVIAKPVTQNGTIEVIRQILGHNQYKVSA
jgi:CheY-like chemotaxis protein